MTPWWEQYPERLEFELEALKRLTNVALDEPKKDSNTGILSVSLTIRLGNRAIELLAEYPPFFPFVRFEVFAPSLDLKRHQNPFSKNLCLLGRSSINWDVEDTLASILDTQLPKLLKAAEEENREAVDGLEEQQGEPFSHYYLYSENSVVYVDSGWVIDAAIRRGRFELEIQSLSPFRARVVSVEDAEKREIATAQPFGFKQRVTGRWVRSDTELKNETADAHINDAKLLDRNLKEPRWRRAFSEQIDVLAVLYPEETGWRQHSDGWLFAVRIQRQQSKGSFHDLYDSHLLRTARAGSIDIQSRAPELAVGKGKRIAVVGLGALGAPSAIEFARSGLAALNLMDADLVEAGNTIRWPLGFSAVGYLKSTALANFISQNYPYVQVKSFPFRLGAPQKLGGANSDQYDEFFSDVDLVCDCTAEFGLHYPISEIARKRKVPYIAMSGTPGLYGGRILRFLPATTEGCWVCFNYWLTEQQIPEPPRDPKGDVAPVGCAEPTFTGTSFNILQISSFGIRLAIDSLRESPEFNSDVYNVSFNSESGQSLAPVWSTYKNLRHPKCRNH